MGNENIKIGFEILSQKNVAKLVDLKGGGGGVGNFSKGGGWTHKGGVVCKGGGVGPPLDTMSDFKLI